MAEMVDPAKYDEKDFLIYVQENGGAAEWAKVLQGLYIGEGRKGRLDLAACRAENRGAVNAGDCNLKS
ncbi:MAG: hypothetical protein NTY01_04220 [Verrucomicrobia bacterium]|nr:hypothetical protein [Verrucomicrobiota bacterium]